MQLLDPYPYECERDGENSQVDELQSQLAERGYLVSKATAYQAWREYSQDMAAGWMNVDENCVDNILPYLGAC